MCQDTMTRLKMAVLTSGEHKQRVQLTISLQGIKTRDEKTGELVFQHLVDRISFITKDASDARAFDYIFMTPGGCNRFIAIKTKNAASQLVGALGELFQVVMEMKQHELRIAKQEKRQQRQVCTPPNDFSNRREVQELICSIEGARSSNCPVPETTPTVDDLAFQSELNCLQKGILQMETMISAAATLAPHNPFETSFVLNPRQQYHPGSRAYMSEPAKTMKSPTPQLPPLPPVTRATLQTAGTFGGREQQRHCAVPPSRTLPLGTLPQATPSLRPTPLADRFANVGHMAEGNSSKRSNRFGELRSPPKTLAELPKPTSGWHTFDKEEEQGEGLPSPAFPPPPPPLTTLDEGFCGGRNASTVSQFLPPVATATPAATTAPSSSLSSSNNILSRCRGQDPFADEFFAAPSPPGSKDFKANASPARPVLLPRLTTSSSPWSTSPQTTVPLRR
ncbi:hypothetical protein V5799_004716 [Amblyomma americanum]|uniref:PID domain-containing protein n=1 Tax=Amblyomma americanum TaxID=6943 RepID=A0AAQ4D5B2_AMBAM